MVPQRQAGRSLLDIRQGKEIIIFQKLKRLVTRVEKPLQPVFFCLSSLGIFD